jgi:hypothetical protein
MMDNDFSQQKDGKTGYSNQGSFGLDRSSVQKQQEYYPRQSQQPSQPKAGIKAGDNYSSQLQEKKSYQSYDGESFDVSPKTFLGLIDKKMVIPFVVLAILVVVALAVYFFVSRPETIGTRQLTKTEQILESSDVEKVAVSSDFVNPEYCFSIADEDEKRFCFFESAIASGNFYYCPEVVYVDWYFSVQECYFTIAKELDDWSICSNIALKTGEFSVNHCLMEIAKEQNDINICDLMMVGEQPYAADDCRDSIKTIQ